MPVTPDDLPQKGGEVQDDDDVMLVESASGDLRRRPFVSVVTDLDNALASRYEAIERAASFASSFNAPPRVAVVDGGAGYIDGGGGPGFATLEAAVLWARGVVDSEGGTVLIRVYHDAGGEPISVDLRDHGIAPDPLDEDIRIVSPVFEAQKQELILYGEADHANLAGTIRHDDLAISINTSS
jgi:hypothetical protein